MNLDCSRIVVQCLQGSDVPPPLRLSCTCQIQREEDDERRNNETAIKRRRGDVVVLQPPAGVAALDEEVEDDADNAPAEVNIHGGGRNQTRAAVDDGRANVSQKRLGPSTSHQPSNDGRDGANEPEPLQIRVDGTATEDAGGANSSPHDRSGVKDSAAGAGIVVLLVRGADVGNVVESPV